MEELLAEQQRIGEEVQKLVRNYKKDSAERKNLQYLNKRINLLKEYRTEFELTDDKIRSIQNPPMDNAYFTEDYYNKIENIVEHYLTELEDMTKDYVAPEKATTIQSESHGILRRFKATVIMISRRCASLLEDDTEYPKQVYETNLKTIQENWDQLQALNLQIWESFENPALVGYDEAEFIEIEEKINNVITNLTLKASNFQAFRNEDANAAPTMQLPKITVPKFSGDYTKWQQFHDLFTEMIDKQSIPQAQKMWYLTASLSGEAARLINHLPITTKNYDTAWQLISERYNKKRAIVASLIRLLVDQNGVGHKSIATSSELQAALTNVGMETKSIIDSFTITKTGSTNSNVIRTSIE